MIANNRSRNHAFLCFVGMPLLFLTVALLGGLRINAEDHAFIFISPPLVTLVLAVLLMLLFVRGRLVELHRWVASDYSPFRNVSHIWLLLTLFFASAQAFFFLWTLWNNQFSSFDARRLLRSLAVLFGTAFVLKHMLLASLYSSDGGWLKRLAGALLQGVSLGTLDAPAFAPATGYISFFTLALYVAGLFMLSFAWDSEKSEIGYLTESGYCRNQLASREVILEGAGSRTRIEVDKRSSAIPPSSDR
jgi:hypothetical protein